MPGMISLAGGLPAPEAFPIPEFRRAFDTVLSQHGAQALQYGLSEGYGPLREFIATRMNRSGVECSSEEILITSGSQQGLDLCGRVFLNPGDKVLVEVPTYTGALQVFDSCEAQYVTVPMDEQGMVTDKLDEILGREKVKLIYALPNFQNPTGRTMSLERRRQLLDAAGRHNVAIIEDDPYGELRYEGEHLPSLKSMDTRGLVIGLGSFSKVLAPGIRLAWMVLPPKLFEKVLYCKQPADLHTSMVVQMAAYELCKDDFVDRHLETVRAVYRERRDAMLMALDKYFPKTVTWTRPEGGLFVWADLPASIDTRRMVVESARRKVAFVPGSSFHVDGSGKNTLRLNFSNVTPERLTVGIERLADVINHWTGLHSFVYGLALKVGVDRLQRIMSARPSRAAAV
ncbi:MAG: PLP-dependent aminotransferase family protein [Chloroflexota bacterium]